MNFFKQHRKLSRKGSGGKFTYYRDAPRREKFQLKMIIRKMRIKKVRDEHKRATKRAQKKLTRAWL